MGLTSSHTGAVYRTGGWSFEHYRLIVSELWWFVLRCCPVLNNEVDIVGIIVPFLQDIQCFLGVKRLWIYSHRRVSDDWVLSGDASINSVQSVSILWSRPYRWDALVSVTIHDRLVSSVEFGAPGINMLLDRLLNALDIEVVKLLQSCCNVLTFFSAMILDYKVILMVAGQVIYCQLTANTVTFFTLSLALV